MNRLFLGIRIVAFALGIVVLDPAMVKASQAEFTDNKDGTVTVAYDNSYSEKVKLVVQKDSGKQYKYDVPTGKSEMIIPLTQGNGTYKVMLCRNTAGTKYAVMQSYKAKLKLSDAKSAFQTSNCMITWEDTNEAIKKAQTLTKKSKTAADKLNAIYKYVVKNFKYDYGKAKNVDDLSVDLAYIPDIDEVLSDKKGICYDISILLAAMLRSVDIPAKVVTGYTSNANTYHAWNDVFYEKDSKWKVIDATYDLQMYRAKKKYSMFKAAKDYSDIVYVY